MSAPIPIPLPFFNVNDESAVLIAWLVPDGAPVERATLIATIETSKAAVDIEAPTAGILRHVAMAGQEIKIGERLGYVAESTSTPLPGANSHPAAGVENRSQPVDITPPDVQNEHPDRGARLTPLARKIAAAHGLSSDSFPSQERVRKEDVYAGLSARDASEQTVQENIVSWPTTRISARARALIERHRIPLARFDGVGMLREQDVLAALAPAMTVPPASDSASGENTVSENSFLIRSPEPAGKHAAPDLTTMAAEAVATRPEALSKRKRSEIKNLASGHANTLPSTIMVACPTRGLRQAAAAHPMLLGNVTALILFEAARLLHTYTAFNGYVAENRIHYYEQVNIGFAVDTGKGLKVPVVHDADRKTMAQIAREMQELLVGYLNDDLTVENLSGATFTISDLSGEGVFTFIPLISSGQAAILGIGGEFFAPGSREGMFNLILTFDHQIGDGRLAAKFLSELRRRIEAYESLFAPVADRDEENLEICCARCGRSADDLERLPAYLLSTTRPDGSTRLLCTLCIQGC